jgi:hypothetical protein
VEIESEGATTFPDVLVTRKGTALTTKVYKSPPTLDDTLTSIITTLHISKEELFAAFIIELLPYAKNDKTCWLR